MEIDVEDLPLAKKPFVPAPVTEFARAKHTPLHEASVHLRPVWDPKPWVPARPGAEDHKKFKSKGGRV
jgi:hypothetical protein